MKTMVNKEKIMDYQEFYDTLIDNDILPARIDYNWVDKNEDFMREVLFAFYTFYTRLKDRSNVISILKLYSEVMLAAHTHYSQEDGYL